MTASSIHGIISAMTLNSIEGNRHLNAAFNKRQQLIPAGATIIDFGQGTTRMCVVQEGLVTVTRGGKTQPYGVGGVIGTEALNQEIYDSTVIAQSDTRIGSVGRAPLRRLINTNPDVAAALPGFLAGERTDDAESISEPVLLVRSLTDRELKILQASANGLSARGIAKGLSLTESTTYSNSLDIAQKFGSKSLQQAVFTGYEMGLVDDKEAVSEVDLTRVQTLRPSELRLLQTLTDNGGANSSNKQIAALHQHSVQTVYSRMKATLKKLHAYNRTQAGIMYLTARDYGLLDAPHTR